MLSVREKRVERGYIPYFAARPRRAADVRMPCYDTPRKRVALWVLPQSRACGTLGQGVLARLRLREEVCLGGSVA